uniref:Uncharacterized protein n=1 Tax=viral metagenome TaxID=1070528 RepID=A0A6H1ZDN4_9ZZZZ
MATVYGTYYTDFVNEQVKGSDQIERGLRMGEVVHIYDYYECAAAASGTVIYLGPIPLGYRLLPASYIYHDDLEPSVTIKVGDGLDDDRYLEATSAAAAAIVQIPSIANINKVPYALASQQPLTITIGGASATGTIRAFLVCAKA